jgi:hypothetical protein
MMGKSDAAILSKYDAMMCGESDGDDCYENCTIERNELSLSGEVL